MTTFHEISNLSKATPLKKLFYRILNYFPLNLSEHIIVTTEEAKKLIMFQDKISPDKISVIPLGAMSKVKKMDKTSAREILGIPVDAKVITQFGFIDNNKGHDKILGVINKLSNTYFIIAGSARSSKGENYLITLKNQIEVEGIHKRVKFLGFINEEGYSTIMGASDIVVFPYSNITSSLALTTTISYNIPILTSDIKPFQEFRKKFGGIITIDVNNQNLLLLSLQSMLYNKRIINPILKNQKAFIDTFSWKEIAKQTMDVYARM